MMMMMMVVVVMMMMMMMTRARRCRMFPGIVPTAYTRAKDHVPGADSPPPPRDDDVNREELLYKLRERLSQQSQRLAEALDENDRRAADVVSMLQFIANRCDTPAPFADSL